LRHAGDYAKNNDIGEVKEDHLELAFLEVTESNQEHGGMGKGTYKEHRLLWEPSIVFKMDPNPARVDVDQ